MAEKILNTRIQLKYDTYANWTTKNPILKKGEVAIATIETGTTQTVDSVTPPQVLIKVGDGSSNYSALPFASALAADVYSWAKASSKPSYNANEITGLADFISGEIQDTDTQYQIVVGDTNSTTKVTTYKLQSKAKDSSQWTDVSTFDLHTDESINKLISEAITALDLANTYDAKGAAADVQSDLNAYKTSNDAAVAAVKSTADAAATKTYVDTELGKKQDNLVFNTAYNKDTNKDETMSDITIATAGLTGAMHFKGVVTSDPTSAEFDKSSYEAGDVVLFGNKEYVFNENTFVELGDEGSYVLKTTTVNGHALSGDITISKGDVGLGEVDNKSEATIKSDFTGSIAENDQGFVKGGDVFTELAKKSDTGHKHTMSDITDLDIGVTAIAEGTTNGKISVTPAQGEAYEVPVHGLGSAAYTETSAYATSAQGEKADSALQEITTTTNGGLKVTNKSQIDIDDSVTFVFDCGNATI